MEAHNGQEIKGQEEELLQIVAGTTSVILDIMRLIRTGDKDKKKGIGVMPPSTPASTPLKA